MESIISHFHASFLRFTSRPQAGKRRRFSPDIYTLGAITAAGATTAIGLHALKSTSNAAFSEFPFASLSLTIPRVPEIETEPKTGLSFPSICHHGKQALAGLGVRSKVLFGIKNLKIYAFGVYVNWHSLKEKLGSKYGSADADNLLESKWLFRDLISEDVELTVRLVIFYKGLKIGQVRNAFEDSIGGRIKKISGAANEELLHSFTKQFKDEFKLERGTTIEISRQPGHVLVTKIGGEEIGAVKSSLLAQAFLDLYLGDEPFDKGAKHTVAKKVAAVLSHEK